MAQSRNTRLRWAAGFAAAAIAAGAAAAAPPDFSRYEVILERQPFGAPPAAPASPAEAPADSPLAALRLSAIVESLGGVRRAGLVDQRTGRSYFLTPGESEEGVELVSIQFAEESATLRWNSQTATLRLQAGAPAPAAPRAGPVPLTARSFPGGGAPTIGAGQIAPVRPVGPPVIRRRSVTIESAAGASGTPAAPPRPSPEEVERQLQQVQMDALRRGLPPLPIPLTPEMDEQLVREGVLPPQ